jgi:hypothetical protein
MAAGTQLGGTIGGSALGPFGDFASRVGEGAAGGVKALTALTTILSSVIGIMTVVAGIWFLINFVIGGINWISAGSDKNTLQSAQQRIQNAFVGLLIVVIGWTVLALAGQFLGYDILMRNPQNLINSVFPGGR